MPTQNLTAELMGSIPRLPYLHALQLLNRAFARIQDMRLWSWQMITDAQIFAPALLNAGTVSATYQSATVTVSAGAATAINAAGFTPPVASPVLGVGRQIKFGGASTGVVVSGGPNYTLANWDGVDTLTLDRPFGEPTVANSGYQIYKCFYAPPGYPFNSPNVPDPRMLRYTCLTNKATGYSIRGKSLYASQDQLNRFDPSRGSTGDPYKISSYGHNSLGQPVFELYPNPIAQTTYTVDYYSYWPDLSLSQDLPQVPYGLTELVMDMARVFACQWALLNVATYPELQQTNWVAAQQMYKGDFSDGLKMCLKQDDEIMPHLPFFQTTRRDGYPMGGQYMQSHDLSWI